MKGVELRLPNGDVVPQLVGEEAYVHLGFEEGGSEEGAAAVVRKTERRCIQAIAMVGSIRGLTMTQTESAIGMATEGAIGYYGRAVLISGRACARINASTGR